MIQPIRTLAVCRLTLVAGTVLVLGACTTSPAVNAALATGQQSTLEGQVVSVDTAPWAYDGNAVVVIATATGNVGVQLPARWNLCKAPPPGDVQALKPGDRVQVIGTVTAPDEVVVCAQPQHRLVKTG
ncbi:hypothetical protein DT603_09530 [Pseudoxanthomonas gei]|uniref:DUF5666 domain-containing protein n=1 Tax=Pseudoxanthomonas gei TaxID=1383030 RepID=A0ABX0ABX5_9GAMM|nr:hypothetical protein [Pseudoxanthomonas gei]NDK39080.1 hypothetical protein [Pseudoxanthomonas gei]